MMEQDTRFFPVFYCDFVHDASISSARPEPLAADRLVPLAEHLLAAEDNYLGVVDGEENILQFYLSGRHIVVELLHPNSPGLLQKKMSVEDAMALLGNLPDAFDETLLPGANFLA